MFLRAVLAPEIYKQTLKRRVFEWFWKFKEFDNSKHNIGFKNSYYSGYSRQRATRGYVLLTVKIQPIDKGGGGSLLI